MRYTVSYWFSAVGTSFGSSDDVCAKTPEEAVVKVRAMHPNAKLRITTVREREGRYAGRKVKVKETAIPHDPRHQLVQKLRPQLLRF
jgi:hypothetical protein